MLVAAMISVQPLAGIVWMTVSDEENCYTETSSRLLIQAGQVSRRFPKWLLQVVQVCRCWGVGRRSETSLLACPHSIQQQQPAVLFVSMNCNEGFLIHFFRRCCRCRLRRLLIAGAHMLARYCCSRRLSKQMKITSWRMGLYGLVHDTTLAGR